MSSPTVILDFDGTVALGTGPIAAFATEIASGADDPELGRRALAALQDFEDGNVDALDGYSAVTAVARDHGLPSDEISAAYMRSRAHLGNPEAPVHFPDGLGDFLDTIRAHADVWLVTNAPDTGVHQLLERAALADRFNHMAFNVGKPDGLVPLLEKALAAGPVLAVGDIYDNDLGPATRLGAQTALVGRQSTRDNRPVTMRAESLDELYPAIEAWVEAAAASGNGADQPISQLSQAKEE